MRPIGPRAFLHTRNRRSTPLLFHFADGGFVFLSVQPMDCGDCMERIVGVGDGPDGWQTICRLVAALERSGITSLTPKPIQLGEPGLPDCWVIS